MVADAEPLALSEGQVARDRAVPHERVGILELPLVPVARHEQGEDAVADAELLAGDDDRLLHRSA